MQSIKALAACILTAGTFIIGSPEAAHANLILNPGFELINSTTFRPLDWTVTDPQSGTVIVSLPGSTNDAICWVAVCPPVFAGTYSLAFGTVGALGSISQTVRTMPNHLYTLSYEFLSDGGPDNQFEVKENSKVLLDETDIPANNPATAFDPNTFTTTGWSSADYKLVTLSFTTGPGQVQTTITFSGEDGCTAAGPPCFSNEWGNLGLDNVSLVLATAALDPLALPSVREPSSFGLFPIGLALLGLDFARRSRRRLSA